MKVFLDDVREPKDCLGYMYKRIGSLNPIYLEDWKTVRNYSEFVDCIEQNIEKITHVSFDHDLADGHYHKNMQDGVLNYDSFDFESDENKTGFHAAKWMKEFYKSKGINLPIMFVHSMNPVGTKNIINVFK